MSDTVVLPKSNRIGLILFALYFLAYAGFMYLSTFKASLLSKEVLGGVNVSVAYGMALIISAFILAGLYLFAPIDESEAAS